MFQRKYLKEPVRRDHWRAIRTSERVRVIDHMVAGRLLPRDVRYLLSRLDQGYGQGLMRKRGGAQITDSPVSAFKPMPVTQRDSIVLAGRIWQRKRLRAEAIKRVKAGDIVTLILLSPTALYHHIRFDPEGFWEQTGGLFGRSDRDDPLFRVRSFHNRIVKEIARVAQQRKISAKSWASE